MWIGKNISVYRPSLLTVIGKAFWLKIAWTKNMYFSERNGYRSMIKLGPIFIVWERKKR